MLSRQRWLLPSDIHGSRLNEHDQCTANDKKQLAIGLAREYAEERHNDDPDSAHDDWKQAMVLDKEDPGKDIRPIKTKADGNCLFNAASIAICQTEILADQLRLQTALELLLNPDFYGSHPVIHNGNSRLLTNTVWRWWRRSGLARGTFCMLTQGSV